MSARGTSNSNQRGSSSERRRRREYLVLEFGDGESCPCYRCGEALTVSTVTADRILAGMDGGTYERGNIRPACSACNTATGNNLREHRRRFPYGHLVRFRRGTGTLWRIVDGEGEQALELRAVWTGAVRHLVTRDRLVDSGIMYGPSFKFRAVVEAYQEAACALVDGFRTEPTRDDFALVAGGKK